MIENDNLSIQLLARTEARKEKKEEYLHGICHLFCNKSFYNKNLTNLYINDLKISVGVWDFSLTCNKYMQPHVEENAGKTFLRFEKVRFYDVYA